MKYLSLSIGGTPVDLPGPIQNITNSAGPFGVHIFQTFFELLLLGASLSVLFFVVFGGFKWMTSQGDKKKIEDARNTIIFSLVGLVVIFLSFLIINLLGTFFNVPLLTLPNG